MGADIQREAEATTRPSSLKSRPKSTVKVSLLASLLAAPLSHSFSFVLNEIEQTHSNNSSRFAESTFRPRRRWLPEVVSEKGVFFEFDVRLER